MRIPQIAFLVVVLLSGGPLFADEPVRLTLVEVNEETGVFINTRGLVEIAPDYTVSDSLSVSFNEKFIQDGADFGFNSSGLGIVAIEQKRTDVINSEKISYALIDRAGEIVLQAPWVSGTIRSAGFFNNGLRGVIGRIGQELEYRLLDDTGKTIFAVRHDAKTAISDYRGLYWFFKTVSGCPYTAFADASSRWGLIDSSGTVVVAPAFDEITLFGGVTDRFVARNGRETAVYSFDGKKVKNLGKDIDVWDSEGAFPYSIGTKNEKYGLLDRNFNVILKPKFTHIWYLCDGLRSFSSKDNLEGKWGYMNDVGQIIIPETYDPNFSGSFSEGVSNVRLDGKYSVIDTAGKTVLDLNGTGITGMGDFSEGFAWVKKGLYGFMDKSGHYLLVDPEILEILSAGLLGKEIADSATAVDMVAKVDQVYKKTMYDGLSNPFRFSRWSDFHDGVAFVPCKRFLFAIDDDKRVHFIVPLE